MSETGEEKRRGKGKDRESERGKERRKDKDRGSDSVNAGGNVHRTRRRGANLQRRAVHLNLSRVRNPAITVLRDNFDVHN